MTEHHYMNVITSCQPLMIIRVPFPLPRWRSVLKAMTTVMQSHGCYQKDISSFDGIVSADPVDRNAEERDVVRRLELAYATGEGFNAFWLYTWREVRGEGVFQLVRQGGHVMTWQIEAAKIEVKLQRDPHLADCGLAKSNGPDATLACEECGRAMWMHKTRHDTCSRFQWVTERSLTISQILTLRLVPGIPVEVRSACGRALNEFGLGAGIVRDARFKIAAAINEAKREARKQTVVA